MADVQWVVHNVPELVDPGATEETDHVDVLAHAVHLRDLTHEVTVVTQDWGEKPTRVALGEACDAVDVSAITMRACFVGVGLGDLLADE